MCVAIFLNGTLLRIIIFVLVFKEPKGERNCHNNSQEMHLTLSRVHANWVGKWGGVLLKNIIALKLITRWNMRCSNVLWVTFEPPLSSNLSHGFEKAFTSHQDSVSSRGRQSMHRENAPYSWKDAYWLVHYKDEWLEIQRGVSNFLLFKFNMCIIMKEICAIKLNIVCMGFFQFQTFSVKIIHLRRLIRS